jgi:hypothetical protein
VLDDTLLPMAGAAATALTRLFPGPQIASLMAIDLLLCAVLDESQADPGQVKRKVQVIAEKLEAERRNEDLLALKGNG